KVPVGRRQRERYSPERRAAKLLRGREKKRRNVWWKVQISKTTGYWLYFFRTVTKVSPGSSREGSGKSIISRHLCLQEAAGESRAAAAPSRHIPCMTSL